MGADCTRVVIYKVGYRKRSLYGDSELWCLRVSWGRDSTSAMVTRAGHRALPPHRLHRIHPTFLRKLELSDKYHEAQLSWLGDPGPRLQSTISSR